MLMKAPLFKMTWKTKILLWINKHWPRVDQWAINRCDCYPCDNCVHFDDYGCLRTWVDEGCIYEDSELS